jgi:hypothetical protein
MYLPADPGLSFVVCSAEAGSTSHHALRLLASWTADDKSMATNEPSKGALPDGGITRSEAGAADIN